MNEALAEKISTEIYEKAKENGTVLMTEIEKIFNDNGFDYKGDRACGYTNKVLWAGWNTAAMEILSKCLNKGMMLAEIEAEAYINEDIPSDLLRLPLYELKNLADMELDGKYWQPVELCCR